MTITTQQLQSIFPTAPVSRLSSHVGPLNSAAVEASIVSPERWAMWLAQLGHETEEFLFLEELWSPTPQQLKYEPGTALAADLGNTQPGDGKLFKGRGSIQTTGRANYGYLSKALGVDFTANPQLVASINYCHRAAAFFWNKHNLNKYADAHDIKGCTKIINGGYTGLDKRLAYYNHALQVLSS